MTRTDYERSGLKLPQTLQDQLGLGVPRSRDDHPQPRRNQPLSRKEQRKADRSGKKGGGQERQKYVPLHRRQDFNARNTEEEPPLKRRRTEPKNDNKLPQKQASFAKPTPAPTKPVLRQPSPDLDEPSEDGSDNGSDFDSDLESEHRRSASPGLVIDKSSRAFKDNVAKDDAEIAALEKRLGLKGKKLPKTFDDELAYLLGGLDETYEDEKSKAKREGDEWLKDKRRKAQEPDAPADEKSDEDEPDDLLDEDADDFSDGDDVSQSGTDDGDGPANGEIDDDNSDFSGFGSEQSDDEDDDSPPLQPRKRENPYVAPVSADRSSTAAKYVPPSLRKLSGSASESLERLRRQIQGHINKLSEANIMSIVNEIEKLYQTNPRQDVTTTLLDILLVSFSDRSQLQNTFVILHAAFIAAIYKVIGTDFGAETISRLVEQMNMFYNAEDEQPGKETVNLISMLSYLYMFHVVGSVLVFDYIRQFLSTVSETNTELLLRTIRDCGPQLRQDDPSSLKDIVLIMQGTIAEASVANRPVSVRTKFMMETITDLKNNKLKSGAAGTTVALEHITRMRKVLGSVNNTKTVKASEPLRISLEDIQNSDKRGKWWLVGASWKEAAAKTAPITTPDVDVDVDVTIEKDGETDLVTLAHQHHMNTSVRRSIFIAIMSASDFRDAHLRLMKLKLKKAQELEMPRVLLHCSGAENVYNPYYTLIAKQLCSENKKMSMAFQFALWGFFKRLGERPYDDEAEDEDSEAVELKEIVNLAKMYGHLIVEGTLTLGVLKVLNLVYLKDQAKTFVEVLLITVIARSQAGTKDGYNAIALERIFVRVRDTPELAKGVQYFVKKSLLRTDLVQSKKEGKMVKWACGVIDAALSSTQVAEHDEEEVEVTFSDDFSD